MSKIKHAFFISLMTFSIPALAADEKSGPEFLWVSQGPTQSSFQAQVGGGYLDDKGLTGHKGSPIFVLFKANYAVNDASSLFIDLPLAGTVSAGNDDFGMGNISIGGNHQFLNDTTWSVGLGIDVAFPTAQTGSLVGVATRNFFSFVKDQYAISPYIDLHLIGDKVTASFDVGMNEQIFKNDSVAYDKLESTIFYDGGLSLAMTNAKDFFATLEFGGYTTLSYKNNDSVFFGGPGARYQDEEFSFGLHLEAPFSSPASDIIDIMVVADTRFKF